MGVKFGSSVARRETEQAWMVGWDVPHGILVTGGRDEEVGRG